MVCCQPLLKSVVPPNATCHARSIALTYAAEMSRCILRDVYLLKSTNETTRDIGFPSSIPIISWTLNWYDIKDGYCNIYHNYYIEKDWRYFSQGSLISISIILERRNIILRKSLQFRYTRDCGQVTNLISKYV